MECLPMSAEFPAHVPFYLARMIISDFVSDYLDEFSIAPKNKDIQQYVFDAYEGLKCTKSYTFLIQLTPEEAFNTVSARSMETYKAPTTKRKLDEAEAKTVSSFKKRKVRVRCKLCEICQYTLKRNVHTLPCGCQFHGKCLEKALEYNRRCPLCYTAIDLKPSPATASSKTERTAASPSSTQTASPSRSAGSTPG